MIKEIECDFRILSPIDNFSQFAFSGAEYII